MVVILCYVSAVKNTNFPKAVRQDKQWSKKESFRFRYRLEKIQPTWSVTCTRNFEGCITHIDNETKKMQYEFKYVCYIRTD